MDIRKNQYPGTGESEVTDLKVNETANFDNHHQYYCKQGH